MIETLNERGFLVGDKVFRKHFYPRIWELTTVSVVEENGCIRLAGESEEIIYRTEKSDDQGILRARMIGFNPIKQSPLVLLDTYDARKLIAIDHNMKQHLEDMTKICKDIASKALGIQILSLTSQQINTIKTIKKIMDDF